MNPATVSKHDIGVQIKEFRSQGELRRAIDICEQAIMRFPNDYFYSKILGDLYVQQKDYEAAMLAYSELLRKIGTKPYLFKEFARRYDRFVGLCSSAQAKVFQQKIKDTIVGNYSDMNISVVRECNLLMDSNIPLVSDFSPIAIEAISLLETDSNFKSLVPNLKKLEELNKDELVLILDEYILPRNRRAQTVATDSYGVAVYERLEKYSEALKLAEGVLSIRRDPVIVRTIFRICRKLEDYSVAQLAIDKYPEITKSNTFHVLYELVYYYHFLGQTDKLLATLLKMEKMFSSSLPITRTLKNFYLRFGMLEDVDRIQQHINHLTARRGESRFSEEEIESEEGITSTFQDLVSKLEHQTQLAAISELTTGISHELGQPITNIRFTIQYYRRLLGKQLDRETIFSVFDSILRETERMGGLINRLAPLTSSKNVIETFDIVDVIRRRVSAEAPRLRQLHVSVSIDPDKPVYLTADSVKFEQVVNNLLVNAIYAIDKRGRVHMGNYINVQVSNAHDMITIVFEDSGIGISVKNKNKIFDPFYSTKPPGEGEGLGLFIIWNILKAFGGTIELDSKYTSGARFVIELPVRSEEDAK